MNRELTRKQQDVFDYIRSHWRDNKRPPTLQDIADHFKFASVTAASDHAKRLQKKVSLKDLRAAGT